MYAAEGVYADGVALAAADAVAVTGRAAVAVAAATGRAAVAVAAATGRAAVAEAVAILAGAAVAETRDGNPSPPALLDETEATGAAEAILAG